MPEALDTNAKALKLNLDQSTYGTFAEIGGGQEVSRWFFRVGAAAGTVAKTISAYDKAMSDAIYGGGERYVSRDRLRSMLDYEFKLLHERLAESRGSRSRFFVFADTVETRNYAGTNEPNGWMGLRIQHEPGAPTSDILLHVSLRDPTALLQQQSLGVLGVNLVFAAFYQRASGADMLAALMDGLSTDSIEIDVVDCSGPAFKTVGDPGDVTLHMLGRGLGHAVAFDEQGRMEQPSTVFRKRVILLHRCSLVHDNPALDRMLDAAVAMARVENPQLERAPLRLLELSVAAAMGDKPAVAGTDARARLDWLRRPGYGALVTNYSENFRIPEYVRRYTPEPIRMVIGLDSAVTILRSHFYKNVDGGMLEGLGRMLTENTRLDVFSMPAADFRERLAAHRVESEFCRVPEKRVLTIADLQIAPPAGHLLNFLRDSGWIAGVDTPGV